MFKTHIAEQSLDELRKSEKQIAQWIWVEASEAKRDELGRQLEAARQQLKRRKRR